VEALASIGWAHAGPSIVAAFLASLVEFVEALTVVLAIGGVRGWRCRSAASGSSAMPASGARHEMGRRDPGRERIEQRRADEIADILDQRQRVRFGIEPLEPARQHFRLQMTARADVDLDHRAAGGPASPPKPG